MHAIYIKFKDEIYKLRLLSCTNGLWIFLSLNKVKFYAIIL